MLKELLKDHNLYHSEFQQDYFITGLSGGTVWGMYKQALRELYRRFRGLREIYFDREKLKIEIEEQAETASNVEDYFKAKLAGVEYRRKIAQMEEVERNIQDTEKEFKRFYQQAVYLKQQLGNLNDERKRQLERETQLFKIKEMMAIDAITRGALNNITCERIHALPLNTRKQLLKEYKNGVILNWYENREDLKLDYDSIKADECLLEITKNMKELN